MRKSYLAPDGLTWLLVTMGTGFQGEAYKFVFRQYFLVGENEKLTKEDRHRYQAKECVF